MKTSDRKTLKGYFKAKSIPTSVQFADFIDSVHNIADDGDLRNRGNGLMLYPTEENKNLIDIFTENSLSLSDIENNSSNTKPCWSLVMDDNKNLQILNENGEIFFSTEAKSESVSDTKNVNVIANGKWHTILIEERISDQTLNCEAYRILAYYQSPYTYKYKFVEATASHCNNHSLKIRSTSKLLGFWFNRMKMRWKHVDKKVHLQIRSKQWVDTNTVIKCNVKKLWDCNYEE